MKLSESLSLNFFALGWFSITEVGRKNSSAQNHFHSSHHNTFHFFDADAFSAGSFVTMPLLDRAEFRGVGFISTRMARCTKSPAQDHCYTDFSRK